MGDDVVSALYYPTWKKYMCIYSSVTQLSVKEKRKIFSIIRSADASEQTLLLTHGMTLGNFCTMQILHDHTNK